MEKSHLNRKLLHKDVAKQVEGVLLSRKHLCYFHSQLRTIVLFRRADSFDDRQLQACRPSWPLTSVPGDANKVLPVAAIYGANGAGKSNLVKALAFLEDLILAGTEPEKPIARRAFLLDKESSNNPTELIIQFVEGDRVYVFGCKVSDKIVNAEWLSLMRDGKEVFIYERSTNDKDEVTIEAGPVLREATWGNHSKVLALTKVGVLPNQLFLMRFEKSLREQDQGPVIAGRCSDGLLIAYVSCKPVPPSQPWPNWWLRTKHCGVRWRLSAESGHRC